MWFLLSELFSVFVTGGGKLVSRQHCPIHQKSSDDEERIRPGHRFRSCLHHCFVVVGWVMGKALLNCLPEHMGNS